MKVAILHDYLNQFGGAERVLEAFLELFPEADIYTLLYDPKRAPTMFEANIKKTSFLDCPLIRHHHRMFIPLMPLAAHFLKSKESYDLVISSSPGYGKAINVRGKYHICYCYTPLRYAWEIDYLKDLPFAPRPLKESIGRPIAGWLREWDEKAAEKVNLFVAVSGFIAQKIKSYYGRESVVLYPPVDTDVFRPKANAAEGERYYLMVGRLLYYKRFDLGINAFNQLARPLKVVGMGPEFEKLKKMTRSPFIEFVPKVSDSELRTMYSNARALIFPQIEDFGLVAAEAQACGCPVIAYRGGGAKEIVREGKTGVFFDEQMPRSLVKAVQNFEERQFNRAAIRRSALRFSKERFKEEFIEIVTNAGFGERTK